VKKKTKTVDSLLFSRTREPKAVKAWAFAWRSEGFADMIHVRTDRRSAAMDRAVLRKSLHKFICGPIVRIEVPAPRSE
jgi:hypothetical protein